jgi:AraC-like DNA-binding protein
MPAPLRPLLVLHPNGAFRARLRALGTRGFRYGSVGSWDELRRAMVESPPSCLLVVDPYADGDRGVRRLTPELRALLWEFPSATVLAAMEIGWPASSDLRTLGEWGVTDVISLEEDDTPEALYRRLRSVEGRSLQRLLARSLPPVVSGRGRLLLMSAAEVVAAGASGRELARRLHLSERSVLRWATRAGLPPPRRLLAWMRMLMAASLLDDPGRTVRAVALAAGYASDSSLRRAMQDFLGAGPTALRRSGAFPRAAAAFVEELGRTRARRGQRELLRF